MSPQALKPVVLILFGFILALPVAADKLAGSKSAGTTFTNSTSYRLPVGGMNFSTTCRTFIKANGSYGVMGEEMIRAINLPQVKNCFQNQADFTHLCPAYPRLSWEEKQRLIIWMFAGISMSEGGCEANKRVWGVNDFAVGYFGLEESRSVRSGVRDPVLCKTRQNVNARGARFQAECAAATFRDGYCTKDLKIGYDFWYWQQLNRVGGRATRLTKEFPHCDVAPYQPPDIEDVPIPTVRPGEVPAPWAPVPSPKPIRPQDQKPEITVEVEPIFESQPEIRVEVEPVTEVGVTIEGIIQQNEAEPRESEEYDFFVPDRN